MGLKHAMNLEVSQNEDSIHIQLCGRSLGKELLLGSHANEDVYSNLLLKIRLHMKIWKNYDKSACLKWSVS